MPTYIDKRRWEEIQASMTLQEVLSGKTVERERLIHMRVYLPESDSVSYWWQENPDVDLESLREQGANQWQLDAARFPYRGWLRANGRVPPWSRQMSLAEQLQRWEFSDPDIDVPTLMQHGWKQDAALARKYPFRLELITRDRQNHFRDQGPYRQFMDNLAREAALRRLAGMDPLDGNPLVLGRPEHRPPRISPPRTVSQAPHEPQQVDVSNEATVPEAPSAIASRRGRFPNHEVLRRDVGEAIKSVSEHSYASLEKVVDQMNQWAGERPGYSSTSAKAITDAARDFWGLSKWSAILEELRP